MSKEPFHIDVKETMKSNYPLIIFLFIYFCENTNSDFLDKSSHYELYKELERINLAQMEKISNGKNTKHGAKGLKTQYEGIFNGTKENLKGDFNNQYLAFHGALRMLIIAGQWIGLNPFLGVLEKDISKIRFSAISLRFFYTVILCIIQMIATMLSFISLAKNAVTVVSLAYVTFYCTTCVTSILFLLLARRWRSLNKEVSLSRLDEYIDPYIHLKCNVAVVVMLSLALFEHILSLISNTTFVMECNNNDIDIFNHYVFKHFPWIMELKVPNSLPLGIILMFTNLVCTMNWSYSHVFIVCVSLYLTSILESINKKIIAAEGQYLPGSFWKALREDYNRATRLIRVFDDYINSIILVAFASNLFFVCLQLYYVLANGLGFYKNYRKECANYSPGPFNGYEHVLYFSFSLAFVLSRSLAVSLIASRVHSASLVPAPSLYSVPSPAYCIEVQRFIEQAHGDTVALTGMNFFYVTRELVLSVAGTIITYELVLLQFNADANTDD